MKSVLWGALASAGVVLALFGMSLLGISQPLTAYILFGTPLSYILLAVVPTSFFYWLAPEGGGPAAVGILFISAFIQSTAVIAAAYLWHSKAQPSN
jgi:hypothetical protein